MCVDAAVYCHRRDADQCYGLLLTDGHCAWARWGSNIFDS